MLELPTVCGRHPWTARGRVRKRGCSLVQPKLSLAAYFSLNLELKHNEIMDPLSALGIASNILAVVDFAWTLLTEARAIYTSSGGATKDTLFVETIVRDVCHLDSTLATSPSTDNAELRSLVEQSQVLTRELLSALEDIKTSSDRSRWKSLSAAFKGVWGKDKLRHLVGNLQIIQKHIARHINRSIR